MLCDLETHIDRITTEQQMLAFAASDLYMSIAKFMIVLYIEI